MGEITANVNWIAVTAGFVLAFALGWLWYSPALFGLKWAQGVGVTFEDGSGPPAAAMITQAIGTFLLAWVIGITAVTDALLTAILIVLAIVFLVVAGGFFAHKSNYAIAVESSYVVAMAVIMIVCQGIF